MGTESPAQSMLNQGTQGSGLTTHPPLGSMMSNSSGSPGVETISSAQHNPQFSGQLSSSQGQVPQNMGSSVGGGMNQLNYQQGLGQSQMIGQGGQQKTGMVAMRDRQQHQMLSSSNLQVQHNMGSNPIQSPTSSQSPLHRSSSAPRLGQLQHYNSPSIRPGQYVASQQSLGGIPFNHPLQQQQQQLGGVARSNMMGQGQGPGHLSMHSGQPGQLSNFPSQYLSQARQKQGPIQGSQFQQAVSSGQPLQGMQTIGMMGSMGLGSQIRNSGALAYQQQRVGQGPLRSQPPSQQQSVTSPQKLQAQSLRRVSSLGAGNSQLPGLSQGGQSTMIPSSLSQPQWLKMHPSSLPSSASPSYQLQQQQRQQQAQSQQQPPPPSLQQQQQSTALHQQQLPQQTHSSQQLQMQQQQVQQSLQQQQMSRLPSSSIQKPATPTGSQPGTPASGATTPAGSNSQGTEASNHILGKRSIQDLVAQVDSHEKLDPEVEDILLEMADDFIHSVTTFACALAKHRKSATLEAKDILLHLERNWQLTIPGFTGEEFKTHKRSSVSETHLQRLAMIQKSMTASQMENEAGNIKGTTGQVIGSSNAGVQVAKVSQSTAPVIPSSTGSPGVHKVPRLF